MTVQVHYPDSHANGWTGATAVRLQRYVAMLTVQLRLSDWDVVVDVTVPSDSCGEVDLIVAQHRAVIRLSAEFLDQPADWQRDTLIHELLHLHLNPVADLSDAMLDGIVGRQARTLHTQAVGHAIEERVDMLAGVLGPQLPLPQLGTASDAAA